MKAKVLTAFPGRPDRETQTRTIGVGEVIGGDIAAVAVREHWAEEVKDQAPAGDEPAVRTGRAPVKAKK